MVVALPPVAVHVRRRRTRTAVLPEATTMHRNSIKRPWGGSDPGGREASGGGTAGNVGVDLGALLAQCEEMATTDLHALVRTRAASNVICLWQREHVAVSSRGRAPAACRARRPPGPEPKTPTQPAAQPADASAAACDVRARARLSFLWGFRGAQVPRVRVFRHQRTELHAQLVQEQAEHDQVRGEIDGACFHQQLSKGRALLQGATATRRVGPPPFLPALTLLRPHARIHCCVRVSRRRSRTSRP